MRFRYQYPNLSLFLSVAIPTLLVTSIAFVWTFLPGILALSAGILLAIQIATTVVSSLSLLMTGASLLSAK